MTRRTSRKHRQSVPRWQRYWWLLPVVVFTSSVEEKDLSESYRRGANAYIRKPIDFREYKELIVDVGTFWIRHNQMPFLEAPRGQTA